MVQMALFKPHHVIIYVYVCRLYHLKSPRCRHHQSMYVICIHRGDFMWSHNEFHDVYRWWYISRPQAKEMWMSWTRNMPGDKVWGYRWDIHIYMGYICIYTLIYMNKWGHDPWKLHIWIMGYGNIWIMHMYIYICIDIMGGFTRTTFMLYFFGLKIFLTSWNSCNHQWCNGNWMEKTSVPL